MPFRIVYIDDEPDLCEIFQDSFSSERVQIDTFICPDDALLAIEKNPPDLVFLDFRLPHTTGDKVALLMNKDIPKVLLTGDLTDCGRSIFVKLFHKPFEMEEIEAFIASYVEKKTFL